MSDYPRDQQDAVELDANRRRYEAERKLEAADSSRVALRQALTSWRNKIRGWEHDREAGYDAAIDLLKEIEEAAEALLAHEPSETT